ncbi:MAG: sulfate transporter CysZ [Chromatiales bacterium]
MKDGVFTGAAYAGRGLGIIFRPGIRRFVLVPLAVNVVIFSLLIWLGVSQFEVLMDRLLPDTGWLSYVRWLLWPLFAVALVVLVLYTFTLVANLIAAPFNSVLAERVEHLITGSPPGGGFDSVWQEIGPALGSELRKLAYFLGRALPLLVLFLIPGVNLLAPVLWFLFNAWFLAIEYADYPMGNHGMGFREQRARLKIARLPALGFGAAVTLVMMVPILNFLAMPAAVAGATAWWCERLEPS